MPVDASSDGPWRMVAESSGGCSSASSEAGEEDEVVLVKLVIVT